MDNSIVVIQWGLSAVAAVVVALVTAIKILWKRDGEKDKELKEQALKMEKCTEAHADCREEVAALKAKDDYQQREIDAIKGNVQTVENTASVAKKKADLLESKVETIAKNGGSHAGDQRTN